MTDRIAFLTVELSEDVREDDIQPLVDALCQFKGVMHVKLGKSDPLQGIAERRARLAVYDKILNLFKEDTKL